MTSNVIREKSRCADCVSDKSRFLKQKHKKASRNKKTSRNNINSKLFIHLL